MAEVEGKFIVINKKHLKSIPAKDLGRFLLELKNINEYLPLKKYYVCNQDEPYAEQVLDIILAGEDAKN